MEASETHFVAGAAQAGRDEGRVDVRIREAERGAEGAFVLWISLRWTDGQGESWDAEGRGSGRPREALKEALTEALEGAVWASRSVYFGDGALLSTLHDQEANDSKRRLALTRLAARRHPEALAPALVLLEGPCGAEEVALGLSVLSILGDRAAVPPVIALLERCRETPVALPALHALGGLGGEAAAAYLFIAAEASTDPRAKVAAGQALEALERRGEGASP